MSLASPVFHTVITVKTGHTAPVLYKTCVPQVKTKYCYPFAPMICVLHLTVPGLNLLQPHKKLTQFLNLARKIRNTVHGEALTSPQKRNKKQDISLKTNFS